MSRLDRRHVVAAVLAVGTVVAALGTARRQPLSWDEAVTVAVATRPVSTIGVTLHHSDAVLGAYYLLMHGWGSLLHTVGLRPTETWWRLPSAVAAVATCVVVAVVARRAGGAVAGLLAGVLLAVSPLFAFYSVDARPYTLGALAAISAWAVWTRPGSPRRPLLQATLVVVLLVVGAWLQLFTVLVWPAFLLAHRWSHRRAVAVLTAATCGAAPLVAVALGQSSEIGWIPPDSLTTTASVVLHVGGGVAVTALGAVVVVLAVRARPVAVTPRTVAMTWWCCAPLTVLAALDVVRPVLVARYALVSVPMVAVALGVLVARARAAPGRRRPVLRAAVVAMLVAAVATSTLQGLHPWKYEDYRTAAAFALHRAPAGTAVLFAPSSARLGFDAYTPAGALDDVALSAGTVRDPLAIGEAAPSLLHDRIDGACRVVLVGDRAGSTSTAIPFTDRVKLALVWGWHVDTARSFGAVSVSVLTNPRCDALVPSARGGRAALVRSSALHGGHT